MKLLSVKEVADRKQSETARDILRTKDVKETLEKMTKDLAETEARFNVSLANQRLRWAQEEESALGRLKGLEDEIKVALDRKKEALVPIEARELTSHNLLTEAEEKLALAESRMEEADALIVKEEELTNALEDKLDSLAERETDLILREQQLIVKEKNLEDRIYISGTNISNAEDAMRKILAEVAEKDRLANLRGTSLNDREKTLVLKETDLLTRERILKDKYDTLQRSITRLKK